MALRTSFHIFVRACQQWSANQDSRLGAALAYYTLFSIAPLLVIAIHIAGFFFGVITQSPDGVAFSKEEKVVGVPETFA